MFCMHCGSLVPEDSNFCIECGTPVQVQQPVEETTQPTTAQITSEKITPPTEPIRCPSCGMLAFYGRKHCLICGGDMDQKQKD